MKKIISCFLTFAILASFLSGCSKHAHADREWQQSETEHWKDAVDCPLDACNAYNEKEAHTDKNNDHKCDVCSYKIPHEHVAGEWQCSDGEHWREVICSWGECEIEPEPATHYSDPAGPYCAVCGYEMPHEIIFSKYYASGGVHWRGLECSHHCCIIEAALVRHSDADENGICDVCRGEIDPNSDGYYDY